MISVGLVVTALLVTGCKTTSQPTPSVVASSPTAQQTRDNLRYWLKTGGSKFEEALMGDLLSTQDGAWQKDPFLTKVVADAMTGDVNAAKNFSPVPDDRAQSYWRGWLSDLQLAGSYLEAVGGGYQKLGDPKEIQRAVAVLKTAQQDLKMFQAEVAQINTAPGTN